MGHEADDLRPSYAAAFRISLPGNPNCNPSVALARNTPFCTVNVSRVAPEHVENVTLGALRAIVEKEIRQEEGQEGWRCLAITKDGRNKDRIKMICRNEAELGKVKKVLESKTESGTRTLRDQLFPVKVDNVNRAAILDEEGKIRPGTEAALGQENGVRIAKIVWLSNKDTSGEKF